VSASSDDAKLDVIVHECIAVRVRLLNRVVTKIYDDELRPFGLKASQMNILVVAWKLGSASPQKVCDLLQLDPSTLSRNVERMLAKSWLQVVPTDDAREQPFRITAQGKALLLKSKPAWEKAQLQAEKLLGKEGMALLKRTVTIGRPR
jgi:DNA-binding MarR family transcriptional regulator